MSLNIFLKNFALFRSGDAIDEWCLDGSLITRIVSLGYERMQAVETVLALHERTKEQLSMELAVEYLCARCITSHYLFHMEASLPC